MTVSPQTRPSGGLRPWQERALRKLDAWDGEPFLLSAAPGAGKTRPALVFARELLRSRVVRRVAVVCPTTPLTRQWAEAAGRLGLHLVPDAGELRPPSDFDGVAVTYARAAASATRWASQCSPGTLVIADEAHHLGDDLAWGTGFRTAFGATRRWLLLSGTPFRSDAMPIPGVTYDDGLARPDVSYSYADAVKDGICRPVTFIPYDGSLSWMSGDDLVEASFSDALTGRDASRRYRTAISTDLGDGLPKILASAHERLLALRKGDHRDAGGLVIAADSSHARRIAKVLRETCGVTPTVVLHAEARAHQKLQAFRTGRDPWIVAVNMVSEGVDIPRLRVGVYATAAKTPLIFRQIIGRFVRTIPGRPAGEHSWVYLPGDPVLRVHAGEVETELRHVLRTVEEPRRPARRARGAAAQRAVGGAGLRPGRGRREPADGALRRRAAAARGTPVAVPRAAGRGGGGARGRGAGLGAPRPAAGQAPRPRRVAAAPRRPLVPRDQRVAEPGHRRDPRRRRVDRAARALDRPAARRAGSPLGRRTGLTPDR